MSLLSVHVLLAPPFGPLRRAHAPRAVLTDGTLVYSFGHGASPSNQKAHVAEEAAGAPAARSRPTVHFLGPAPPLLARVAAAQVWPHAAAASGLRSAQRRRAAFTSCERASFVTNSRPG